MTTSPSDPSPEDWQRLESVFAEAIELAPRERAAYVAGAFAGERELHRRLISLLNAHETLETGSHAAAGFLSSLDASDAAVLFDLEATEFGGDEAENLVIGRYRTVRRLGRGGMGVVYLAHDPVLGRPVALKLLPAGLSTDRAANRRLLEEARASSALDHPHICTVFEAGEAPDGRLYIAMAFHAGETLRDRLSRGALPIVEAVEITRQIADGLAAAHARGIVHRDIKPENVVFGGDGSIRILDFGLAIVASNTQSGTGAVLGTVGYMSPEQTLGAAVDPRTDVWSLGVVLYEMLTGRRPFAGDASEVVIHGIRHDDPEPLRTLRPEVPPALATIVARCMVKDLEQRLSSAAELRNLLAGLANVRDRRDADTQTPSAPRNRGSILRVAPWIAAAVVVLLVLGFATGEWRGLPRIIAAEGWAGDAFQARGRVLVADFTTSEDAKDVALATREALAVDLQQSRFLSVVGRAEIAGILQRMGQPDTARLELPIALEVAERAGAGAVLTATVTRLGTQYVLSGRAVRTKTGDELFAVRTTASPDRLLGAVEQLSREMRRRLGEEREEIRESRPLPEVSTASLQALRLYAEADRLLASRYDAAAGLVAEAIRSDTSFAMAHRMAAAIAYSQLRFGDAEAHLTRAFALRDRLTERERWHIEALYHASVALEPRRAADAYEMLLQRYPDDWRAANNLAGLYQGWLDDQESAYTLFRQAVELNPTSPVARIAAMQSAFQTGRTAELDSLLALAATSGHEENTTRWRIAHAFATGEYRTAGTGCDSLLNASARQGDPSLELELCGSIDIASGRLRRGIERLEAVERTYLETNRYRNLAHAGQAIALAHALRGDSALASGRLELLLERIPADVIPEPDRFITRTNLQVQAALLGRTDLMDRIAAQYPQYPDSAHWFGRAGDALVRAARYVDAGDGEAAIRVLRSGWPRDRDAIGWRIWNELLRGMAFDLLEQPDSAAARYRRAADPRLQTPLALTKNRIYLPIALQRLAAAQEANGDSAGARESHARLLELWSGADAEMNEAVSSARTAVARLGG